MNVIAPELWELSHPFRLMRIFPLGHRMTVARSGADLVVHSQNPLGQELQAQLEALGTVRYVLVADLVFHFPSSTSLALRTLLKMVGAFGRLAPSRLYKSFIKDRPAKHRAMVVDAPKRRGPPPRDSPCLDPSAPPSLPVPSYATKPSSPTATSCTASCGSGPRNDHNNSR